MADPTSFERQAAAPADLHDLVTASAADNNHTSQTLLRPMSSALPLSPPKPRRRSGSYGETPRPEIHAAEKTGDDPTAPSAPRYASFEPERLATPTRVNRLFTSPVSPSSSRQTSFQNPRDKEYVRSLSSDAASLNTHLYSRGFLAGRHSDITVHVFGRAYALHKIVLDRAPFFSSALTEPWLEASSKDITLHPEDIDPSITPISFELALKRLYGCQTQSEEEQEATSLFATGCWLEMQDLVDAATTAILRQMHTRSLGQTIQLVTNFYYGRPGDKILASAKAMLCRDGWSMPLSYWDSIPSDVIRELVGGDSLFITGEWHRWLLAKRIFDRKLHSLAVESGLLTPRRTEAPAQLQKMAQRSVNIPQSEDSASDAPSDTLSDWQALYQHPDIVPLLELLDEGIYYMHLGFEHLQSIRNARDILGVPLLPDSIVSNALWKSLELRQKIINSGDADEELGLACALSASTGDAEPESRKFWIPRTDCNIVVGGSGDSIVTAPGHVGTTTAQKQPPAPRENNVQHSDAVQWFSDFMRERAQASSSGDSPDLRPAKYSTFPPFRFAVDFPNPRTLKEKRRVYSQTVFYAGSFWNVYIQKVRTGTRNPQLGVYLHRARDREVEGSDTFLLGGPGVGSRNYVDDRIGALEREMQLRSDRRSRRHSERFGSDPFGPPAGPSVASSSAPKDETNANSSAGESDAQTIGIPTIGSCASASRTTRKVLPARPRILSAMAANNNSSNNDDADYNFISSPGYDSGASSSPPSPTAGPLTASVATLPPYADARPTIRTYFKIYSPSKGGRMLSVYESAPDCFNFSQSWGWKSSTLMLDDAGVVAAASSHTSLRTGGGIGGGMPDDDLDAQPHLLQQHHPQHLQPGGNNDDDEHVHSTRMRRGDGKLRFAVVLGVV